MPASERITDALAEYEAGYEFARLVTLPVEDRAKYMPAGEMVWRIPLVS